MQSNQTKMHWFNFTAHVRAENPFGFFSLGVRLEMHRTNKGMWSKRGSSTCNFHHFSMHLITNYRYLMIFGDLWRRGAPILQRVRKIIFIRILNISLNFKYPKNYNFIGISSEEKFRIRGQRRSYRTGTTFFVSIKNVYCHF